MAGQLDLMTADSMDNRWAVHWDVHLAECWASQMAEPLDSTKADTMDNH